MNETHELSRFLLGKSGSLDFARPIPQLVRSDSRELRDGVLELSAREARKLGISKSTLHNLRKRAANSKPFRLDANVVSKLLTRYDPMTDDQKE